MTLIVQHFNITIEIIAYRSPLSVVLSLTQSEQICLNMGKGRKAKALPDCEFSYLLSTTSSNSIIIPVIEISDDLKRVRCNICEALRGQGSGSSSSGWIQKESLTSHLKSDVHAQSVSAQQIRESMREAGKRSMQEESEIEAQMDFVMLPPSTSNVPAATAIPHVSVPSQEEQEMWRNYEYSGNILFNAGIDPAAAAAEERKRLEKEATDFDLWKGSDFLPEEDPTNGELLLDELEQEDILNEILQNAGARTLNCSHYFKK